MKVKELLALCIEPLFLTVEIFDIEKSETVWTGEARYLPSEYAEKEIGSFDVPASAGQITINI